MILMISYYPNIFEEFLLRRDTLGIHRLENDFRRRGHTHRPVNRNRDRNVPDTRTLMAGSISNSSDSELCREDLEQFSHSMEIERKQTNATEDTRSAFVQSVFVAPTSTEGHYSVHSGAYGSHVRNTHSDNSGKNSDQGKESFLDSLNYDHNIGNPELWQLKYGNSCSVQNLKSSQSEKGFSSRQFVRGTASVHSEGCECGNFHSHRFKTQSVNSGKYSVPRRNYYFDKPQAVDEANKRHMTICNIFWNAQLNFCEYTHGSTTVSFSSLWPPESTLNIILQDGIEDVGLKHALWDLCLLVLAGGPTYVLKALLSKKIIRLESQFGGDASLLHLACCLQNTDAALLLTQIGISYKLRDKEGKMAGEVCHCPRLKKQLPAKYLPTSSFLLDRSRPQPVIRPNARERENIFSLAASPKHLYELQKILQACDFQVNKEQNRYGNYLLHIACQTGLCQLPLIISLVRLQSADVNLYNGDGKTPLMVAAETGDSNLCDVLMCLFGADPNKQNSKDGKTALHLATLNSHINVVSCLLKRCADLNVYDLDHCRPDDLLVQGSEVTGVGDCQQMIRAHRSLRMQNLSLKIKNDIIYPLDLRVSDVREVNDDGLTLVMIAASHDRVHNLEGLLKLSTDSINAQHWETGMTALSMAARAGNDACCALLMKHGCDARIQDMKGFMAIHHAVLNNHEQVVDVFVNNFPSAYVGLYLSLRLCRKSSIHDKLTAAWERRQTEIVAPLLRICAIDGNASRLYCELEEGDNVNTKNNLSNQPALFVAIENGHLEVLQLLEQKGGDVSRRDARTGNTVLHTLALAGAIETGRDLAEYLLPFCQAKFGTGRKAGRRLDVNAVNTDRKTALQIAAEKGNVKLVKLLIDHGAATGLLNQHGTLFTSSEFEGARVLIEGHRNEHTNVVMKFVVDKGKKALPRLTEVFIPRFDHNLRDRHGNTPLLIACKLGRPEVISFLLQSAVYANQLGHTDDSADNSDADSGVPDLPPWKSHLDPAPFHSEDALRSLERSGEMDTLPLGASCDFTRSLNPSDMLNALPGSNSSGRGTYRIQSYLTDIERPKGLYIYHDGVVSHVCAVNLFDGNTCLHHVIERGDLANIASALLNTDSAVVNMQNDAGFTPVHLACKLGRKKILEKLLAVKGVDLSLLTLTGQLPEEVTKNKSVIRMLLKAKMNTPVNSPQMRPHPAYDVVSLTESLPSIPSTSGGSTINFDKVNEIYQSLRVKKR